MQKEWLYGKTLPEIKQIVTEQNLPQFAAKQITDWLYKKEIGSIDEMTNLSVAARKKLSEKYEFGLIPSNTVQQSVDGTKKYLFPALSGKFIESAYIPDEDRSTLCVSTQVGCKMGCLFCMTAKQGFQGNLSTGEILNQIRSLPEFKKLTNVVYMGMGEPFDNLEAVMNSIDVLTADYGYGWSPKRITVSSIGIIPGMAHFLKNSKAHLAISLHSPFDDERASLMPIQNVYPVKKVLAEIQKHDLGGQRRVSFEYIMFKGVNDTPRHVNELSRILNKIKCRINLIRFHPIPNSPLQGSDEAAIIDFQNKLKNKGITTTLRASRGLDIFAACGLLSTKELNKK